MGKGDTPRPVNKERFDDNFERIFGKRTIKTWTPDGDDPTGDRPNSGSVHGVQQEPSTETDPETTNTMEGEES